ncbi:MAG: tripartite tricarboxylate transporter substrate binding protein [Burkholderiales bacterium]|nr:tripartite tricarboxylate transporter substrate binding protein [Burkholderiales bacterium]
MKSLIALCVTAIVAAVPAAQAQQSWSPSRNVEIVVGSAPGGSNDKTARTVERAIVEGKLLPVSLTVVNRPGGGSTIAFNYVNQKKGDPHTLLIGTTALLTNHIVGTSQLSYMDFTPVASLFNDYVVFAVNANSPIKTGKDLIAKLKENPQSVSIAFATTLGSHNHIAAGLLAKSVGVNARNLKAIAIKGSAEAITQVLGGHIDLVTTAAGNVAGHVAEGRLRVIGVSAEKRFPGAFAHVPTWKEQGANLVYGGWRAIMAPKDITPAQIAYWEGVLRKVVSNPDWKADLEKNYWSDDFVGHAQFSKDIVKDYNDIKAVLVDIGLAKQ